MNNQELSLSQLGEETVIAFMVRTVNHVQNHNQRLVEKARKQQIHYQKEIACLRLRIAELEEQVDETVKLC